ncbi:MAG TPA: serine/threonine-protein kinase, partial [Kofleriaceae bacterium]|nr:serine/threonine-protein kinase [Kofleriaceae bacterium]
MERADLTGAVLDGRYRVIEPVAQGAMGVVYRAERIKLGRIVAIKVLHESLPAELSSRRRFEVEAMAMAKLEHPHCAAVVDVGLHEDRPFVVMDFVSGQDLRSVITAEAPLPIPRAIEMMRQILSGLAHAHEHGIIHRDIKPANLVLSQKAGLGDHVKILDFGLARLGQDSSLTTGIVVGTPSYMAPEQIRGQPIDGRVDVYACGVVLFELLTGDKPFVSAKDDPIEVCSLHLKQAPPRLADRRPGVEFGELEAVVARALAKSASERFASAVEFAAALDAIVPRRATPVAGVPALEPGATLEYAGAPAQVRTATPPAGVRTLPLPVLAEPAAGP